MKANVLVETWSVDKLDVSPKFIFRPTDLLPQLERQHFARALHSQTNQFFCNLEPIQTSYLVKLSSIDSYVYYIYSLVFIEKCFIAKKTYTQ